MVLPWNICEIRAPPWDCCKGTSTLSHPTWNPPKGPCCGASPLGCIFVGEGPLRTCPLRKLCTPARLSNPRVCCDNNPLTCTLRAGPKNTPPPRNDSVHVSLQGRELRELKECIMLRYSQIPFPLQHPNSNTIPQTEWETTSLNFSRVALPLPKDFERPN